MKYLVRFAVFSLCFSLTTSCSSDDTIEDEIRAQLIGKWINVSVVENGDELELVCPFSEITFREDNRYLEEFIDSPEENNSCDIVVGSIRGWSVDEEGNINLLSNAYFTSEVELMENQLTLTRKKFNPVTETDDNYIMVFTPE